MLKSRSRFSTLTASWLLAFAFVLVLSGCGGGSLSSNNNPVTGGNGGSGTLPSPDHVFLVVLENHSFSNVIGSPAMPYLNGLANSNALAANYFAVTHPSLGNYFMLTAGELETNPVLGDSFPGPVTDDNLVRAFAGSGKTWKAYMQSLPSPGYIGPDVGPYVKRHNPFAYFTDVAGANGAQPTAMAVNIVNFTQLGTDIAANAVPNFAFIAPDVNNDAHDCPGGGTTCADTDKLTAADNWLRTNIDPLIHNPALSNSVFIITFDEGLDTDLTNGGGQVATVLVGTHVKMAFRSSTLYLHQNTLRLILDLLKVGDHPGLSSTATTMAEFFQ
jgi:acid phosphatase